ncbi:MAG: MFS transporter [Candidatus Onthomonas sp.]
MTQEKEHRLSNGEKLCYSFGDCGGQIYVALCTYFLTGYYTDTVGIAAAAVGTMMVVARIFDGTSDLLMGALVDKTKSKYGKARPWILWTAPMMALALIALFSVPASMSETGKLVYAYITYILLNCIIYTANGIAYNSLLARMTFNVQDRCSCTSIRFVLGTIVTLIVNAITSNLVTVMGWTGLVVVYAIVQMILLLICFFGCKEHIGETDEGEVEVEKVPLKIALPALTKNKYFFLQALMMVFLYINIMSVGSMTYYFCNTVLGSLAAMTVLTMAYNVPTIIGSFINPYLVAKMGKRKVLIACFILSMVGRAIVGAGGTSIPIVLVGAAIHGLALGPIYSDVFAMTPDIVDYGEWKTGIRSEGLITCCVSFGMKVGIGVGGAVATWVLTFGGYDGTAAAQTASAISAIQFGFGYLSVILSAVCLVIILLMNLDKDIHQIQSDLTAKHSQAQTL